MFLCFLELFPLKKTITDLSLGQFWAFNVDVKIKAIVKWLISFIRQTVNVLGPDGGENVSGMSVLIVGLA